MSTVHFDSPYDHTTVMGLLASPRDTSPRGCVIWEFGVGSNIVKDAPAVGPTLAELGLTTFSIDIRDNGGRSSGPAQTYRTFQSPEAIARMIRGTVGDIRGAVDYLERQSSCRRNIGYVGISLGGIVGTLASAADRRIDSVVLMSTAGSIPKLIGIRSTGVMVGVKPGSAKYKEGVKVLAPLSPANDVGRISPRPLLILSGREDDVIAFSNAEILHRAARQPVTIVDYDGGHDPFVGPATLSNYRAVTSFLLRTLVEPTFSVRGSGDGTYLQQQ